MKVNRHVLIATGVIVAGGVIKKWSQPQTTLTKVFVGGIIFMMALSVMDLVGGTASKIASSMAMLAMVTVILTDFPWDTVFSALKIKTPTNSKTPPKTIPS